MKDQLAPVSLICFFIFPLRSSNLVLISCPNLDGNLGLWTGCIYNGWQLLEQEKFVLKYCRILGSIGLKRKKTLNKRMEVSRKFTNNISGIILRIKL